MAPWYRCTKKEAVQAFVVSAKKQKNKDFGEEPADAQKSSHECRCAHAHTPPRHVSLHPVIHQCHREFIFTHCATVLLEFDLALSIEQKNKKQILTELKGFPPILLLIVFGLRVCVCVL